MLKRSQEGGKIVSNGTIAGVIVGVVAAIVIVAYVVIHESSKKRSITGCVTPAENGMSVTDEKDKRSYALSGDTADIKPKFLKILFATKPPCAKN